LSPTYNPRALDTIWALLLIGLAVFVGGIVLRRVPSSWLAIGAVIVVFGLGIPALVIDDNKESTGGGGGGAAAAAPSGGGSTSAGATGGTGKSGGGGGGTANAQGKLIFQQNCGTCHTLADAGTNGQVGPNLDEVKPNKQRVQSAIEKGGLGSGTMPAGIVSGKEEKDVAEYVSSVAGK
jgi:mono/diheme cytochrome c family protein